MHKLVLIRHGESTWNLENRFTGWTDVDLTPTGIEQAIQAGRLLKAEGYDFDLAYTSVLTRAIRTLHLALDEMDRLWMPTVKHWRLNERHYGALQGLNKADMAWETPVGVRSTSVHPVKRFSRFQVDSPWRIRTSLCMVSLERAGQNLTF